MARKLKTFTTSAGFFDLAVAAPSMKAALEAWGSHRNLFHDGFARQSDDPAIVEATMARPGVVLRRPVGTDVAFSEHSELPKDFGSAGRASPPERRPSRKEGKPPAGRADADAKAAARAAAAFERERERRERRARKEQEARERQRERRDSAVAAAEAALEEGREAHRAAVEKIEKARRSLDRKLQAEEARWARKKDGLEEALRRARSPSHLKLV
jgi:flagellar biosynthesis GTPase FlhF